MAAIANLSENANWLALSSLFLCERPKEETQI